MADKKIIRVTGKGKGQSFFLCDSSAADPAA